MRDLALAGTYSLWLSVAASEKAALRTCRFEEAVVLFGAEMPEVLQLVRKSYRNKVFPMQPVAGLALRSIDISVN